MALDEAQEAALSGYSRGKLRRRRAIVDATRALMAQSDGDRLTVGEIAAEAGVSPATPYNLFGTKQAILAIISDEELRGFKGFFAERASPEPLLRLFDCIDLAIAYWARSPDFYRHFLRYLQQHARENEGRLWSVRIAFIRNLIGQTVAAGVLRADTPIDLVTSLFMRTFKSIMHEWYDGGLTLDAAHNELGASLALILANLVSPDYQPVLAGISARYGDSQVTSLVAGGR